MRNRTWLTVPAGAEVPARLVEALHPWNRDSTPPMRSILVSPPDARAVLTFDRRFIEMAQDGTGTGTGLET